MVKINYRREKHIINSESKCSDMSSEIEKICEEESNPNISLRIKLRGYANNSGWKSKQKGIWWENMKSVFQRCEESLDHRKHGPWIIEQTLSQSI